jgi:hypothetical protein
MFVIEDVQYLYLIWEARFVEQKINIFKPGKTTQENLARIRQYAKGSILLFQIICDNCHEMERKILNIFKQKFQQCKHIGTEYFYGDYKDMINIIYNTVMNISISNKEPEQEKEKEKEEEEENDESTIMMICD